MFRVLKLTLLTACVVLVASCAVLPQQTRFFTTVDSLAAPAAAAMHRYILLPADDGISAGDLQFQEFAGYVDRALERRGFEKAEEFADADIAIFLSYAIGGPQTHRYTYRMPTWGQTGVSGATTTATVSTYGNTSSYSANTTYTPTYGVTGYTAVDASRTTSTRSLVVLAYDASAFKKNQSMSEVWKTTVVSTGSSSDLRRVFPYMVVAMLPYMATNTGQKVEVTVAENSPVVVALRAGSR